MKIRFASNLWLTFSFFLLLIAFPSFTQIVKLVPPAASPTDSVEILFDASQGTKGLVGAAAVYMHSGVITSSPTGTDWQNVVGNWGKDDGIGKMTKVPNATDLWSIKLKPSIRSYYKVAEGTTVFRLAMVFRNADGSKEGKGTAGTFPGGTVASNGDIFLDLPIDNYVQITSPLTNEVSVKSTESVTLSGTASSVADSMQVLVDAGNGLTRVFSQKNTQAISYRYFPAQNAEITFKITAFFGTKSVEQSRKIRIILVKEPNVADLPTGVKKGINYYPDDATKATLVLQAPDKQVVYVVGDFTEWEVKDNFLMNRTPDGEHYWLTINNLTPKKEYVFQYWVDGTIKIGDPYADKVADPWNDKYIPASVYPNLPEYTYTNYEMATVLQTAQTPFAWAATEASRPRPDKNNLVIYELLVRDFIGSHNYKDLTDTLSYLKRLGVNAIELMPVMEFEGNESWGYNPVYFFAPDKYYGTKNDLKNFIQTAHREGFVVLLDMVLNHAFGQNPLVKMYFKDGKPYESPWFNADATHPFNVGYDFNHESPYTQAFVDSVNTYWLNEYHFDGFRFDLSKGFTQRNNPANVEAWSAYDPSRIAILRRMAAKIRAASPEAYIILEHFAAANEETELKNDGMMVWGNSTYDYGNLIIGNGATNIGAARDLNRVSYMESHDEERLLVKALTSANRTTTYAVNDTLIALNRGKLLAAFFFPLPGAKMLWQFQELGYDKSIEYNGRLGNKPQVWGAGSLHLYDNPERQKLFSAYAAVIDLVKNHPATFSNDKVKTNLGGTVKTIYADGDSLDAVIVGNFALTPQTVSYQLTHTGTWYPFFPAETDSMVVTTVAQEQLLQPGELVFWVDKKPNTPANLVQNFAPIVVTSPETFSANQKITLTFRAKNANPVGTDGLIGSNEVYMVGGVVTSSPNDTTLTQLITAASAKNKLSAVAGKADEWQLEFTPREFFGVAAEQAVYRLGIYFQNADGSRLGKNYGGGSIFLNLKPEGNIVTVTPAEFQSDTPITIVFDAAAADPAGTPGLIDADKVYMHAGIITGGESATDWQYVVGNWGKDDGIGRMTKVSNSANKWQITLTPKSYFPGVPATATWYRIGMVFRNADGSRQGKDVGGKDIFVNFTEKATPEVPLATERTETTTIVYPNPTKDKLLIQTPKTIEKIEVYTLGASHLGNLPFERADINQYQVDLQRVRPGTYIFLFKHPDGIIAKRILIQK